MLTKSNYTAREIQIRYEHMNVGRALSVGKAVVIRDEGDAPIVQVAIASKSTSLGYDMGDNDGCGKVQLFVDGVQRDLVSGSGQDGKVTVKNKEKDIWIHYIQSGMQLKIRYHRCRLNVCVTLPDTDETIIGLLGTPTMQVEDDWTIPDGTELEIPVAIADRVRKPAYDFCTKNYCVNDASDSLFTYNEEGFDFDYYNNCDLPFDSTIEEYVGDGTPQWIIDVCNGDLQCVIDLNNGNEHDPQEISEILQEYSELCNPTGGECDESSCCSSECKNLGGLAGKVCSNEVTVSLCSCLRTCAGPY